MNEMARNAGDAPQFLRTQRPERRNVRWGHPLGYIIAMLPQAIEDALARVELRPGNRILDYGCAEQPYRDCFAPELHYIGADLPGNPLASLEIRPGQPLDLETGSVDLVLSSQVLEHVTDPAAYLRECRRVLRPGGRLVLSTHGIMPLHRDPVDYWRWTCDGLRHAIAAAGFDVDELRGVMGLGATGVQLFQDATILRLPRRLWRPYAWVMQGLARWVDRLIDRDSRDLNALVFVVLATRSEDA